MPYIQARSATRDLWLFEAYPGAPEYGRFILPDGTDVYLEVDAGNVEQFGFLPRFKAYGRGHRTGDLIWTGGAVKIVSPRFVAVLEASGATGYKTYPIEVIGRATKLVEDYRGMAVLNSEPTTDLWNQHPWNSFGFFISDRVYTALVALGANVFELADPPGPCPCPDHPPIEEI